LNAVLPAMQRLFELENLEARVLLSTANTALAQTALMNPFPTVAQPKFKPLR